MLTGAGVGRGAGIGPVVRVSPAPVAPSDEQAPDDREATAARATAAFDDVAAALRAQADGAEGAAVAVLQATAQMAQDRALRTKVLAKIAAGEPPVAALDSVVQTFVDMFTAAGGMLLERVTDLRSVRDRVAAHLLGVPVPGVPQLTGPAVVVAEDLAPADTAALDLRHVVAIVTEQGGTTSHTAIIAGQRSIPCLVRVNGALDLAPGTVVAVDAAAGTLEVDPGPEVAEAFTERARLAAQLAEDTSAGATADGVPVGLLANIGTAADAERAAATAVEGVGLFRTEVLFLDRTTAPTREEQAAVYAEVLRSLGGRKVVVRTLDAGADKPLAFATQPDEENPALGVRGYRLVRTSPELLETQLAALADAQRETGIEPWVMAPMISTPDEARDFATSARAHGLTTVGVMVEVPAAALRAEAILDEVDFVSMGTNDLAQYVMASDRLRGELSDLISMWQPAVLDLVAATARAGARAGKPAGVCGESAGDPVMAVVLVGLGVSSLSMSSGSVPAVRFAVSRHTQEQARAVAEAALGARSAEQARAAAVAALVPEVAALLGA